jgi:hypothetical protein
MDVLRVSQSPFDNLPEKQRSGALDAQQMSEAVWVQPYFIARSNTPRRLRAGNIRGHGSFGELL